MSTSGRTALIALLIFVAAFAALRKPILQDRIFGSLRPLITSLCPPRDFYTPVLEMQIDTTTTNKIIDAVFANRYVGRHVFGVFAKNFPKGSVAMPGFQLKVRFLDGPRELGSLITGKPTFTFWGVYGGDGFAYCVFDVPGNLPLGEPLHCAVSVITPDPDFQAAYGPVTVFVAKDPEM